LTCDTPTKAAAYFHLENGGARCELCPNSCLIPPGQTGLCRVRQYQEGYGLVTTSYGNVSAIALDPIEKKPLYHFYPGTNILSLGTFGCNLRCRFCQNWHISQSTKAADTITPQAVVQMAKEYKAANCIGVAFTYNEPTIWYEFIWDTAKAVHAADLKNVLVTNGFISSGPWQELLPMIDAVNIDVKAWSEEFYRELCGGSLQPVLDNAQTAADYCHVELTYLIIPGHNDDLASLEGFARWVRQWLGAGTPIHFSRYFPNYQLDIPPTPIGIMEKAQRIASEWLDYVYLGNVEIAGASHTYCPFCQALVIERSRSGAPRIYATQGHCPDCGMKLPLIIGT
jgi:pyruvate formate lyase activating enzyme